MSIDSPPVLLTLMTLAWYVAVRAAVDAAPARWATLGTSIALALPVIAIAAVGAFQGRIGSAVTLCFGSAVGALTLGMGVTLLSAPPAVFSAAPARWWMVLVPIAAAALLGGFAGSLGTLQIAALGGMALVAVLLTSERDEPFASKSSSAPRVLPAIQWLLAMTLAGVGAMVGLAALLRMRDEIPRADDSILTTIMVGPASVLPMIGVAAGWLRRGRADVAVRSLVGSAVVCLAIVLPLIGLYVLRTTETPASIPVRVWRIDSVVLMVIAIALVPASLRRLRLGRLEGAFLLALYGGYLLASVIAGR